MAFRTIIRKVIHWVFGPVRVNDDLSCNVESGSPMLTTKFAAQVRHRDPLTTEHGLNESWQNILKMKSKGQVCES